jgi:N-methylhydantoinase A/oxoprolinase/acetone carboxylase beta subunit
MQSGSEPKGLHLVVNPANESRAREIIREVLDASPPE